MELGGNVYVVIGILSTAGAQIALKVASGSGALSARSCVWGLVSIGVYGLSFLSYFFALRVFEISKVQPIMMASTTAIIALYGGMIGEGVSAARVAGILLAVASVALVSRS